MSNNLQTLLVTTIIIVDQPSQKLCRAIWSVAWCARFVIVTQNMEFTPEVLRKLLHKYLPKSVDITNFPPLKVTQLRNSNLDFSMRRNVGASEAETEWLFFLDSDEVFPDANLAELQLLLENPTVNGYQFKRRDYFLDKPLRWGEVHDIWVTRLVRKGKGQWQRPVHEVLNVKGLLEKTEITLQHYSHDSISSFFAKVINYAQLEAEARYKNHQSASVLEILIWPVGKFLVNYFLKLGLLDGWRGLVYASMMSVHSFAVRALLYEKNRN
jgi:glycosyltransferase involved in cell wall biosynthesis